MSELASWSGFYWTGVAVVGIGAVAFVAIICVLLTVLAASIFPKFHCRVPATRMILSTYRTDCFTGDGKHIKSGVDLRISRIVGLSWKVKWVFGLIVFGPDDTPSISSNQRGGA